MDTIAHITSADGMFEAALIKRPVPPDWRTYTTRRERDGHISLRSSSPVTQPERDYWVVTTWCHRLDEWGEKMFPNPDRTVFRQERHAREWWDATEGKRT